MNYPEQPEALQSYSTTHPSSLFSHRRAYYISPDNEENFPRFLVSREKKKTWLTSEIRRSVDLDQARINFLASLLYEKKKVFPRNNNSVTETYNIYIYIRYIHDEE